MKHIGVVLALTTALSSHAQQFTSFSNSTHLDPGLAVRLVTDNAGTSYLAWNASSVIEGCRITRLNADGSVRSTISLLVTAYAGCPIVVDIVPGDNGSIWVAGPYGLRLRDVTKFDAAGNLVFSYQSPEELPVAAITSDSVGNIFVARGNGGLSIGVDKLDLNGRRLASFRIAAQGTPKSIAVDAAGAVYIAGQTSSATFPTTPGAFMEKSENLGGPNDGWAMKLSPDFDRMVYSTLLSGVNDDDASSIAVDGEGNAYVSGVTGGAPTRLTSSLKQIGNPVKPGESACGQFGYVLKLNSVGSDVIYSAGLCDWRVRSAVLASDGKIHGVASELFNVSRAILFTISADGSQLERTQTLNGIVPAPQVFFPSQKPLDISLAPDGSIRVLMHSTSSSFPGIYGENLPLSPFVVEVPSAPVQADLQLTGTVAYGTVVGADTLFEVTVANHGPSDAEGIEVRAFQFNVRSCSVSVLATCVGPAALIPRLRAGASATVELRYRTNLAATLPVEVTSLTSDVHTVDNFTDVVSTLVSGHPVRIGGPQGFLNFYRSDISGVCIFGSDCATNATAAPLVTLAIPSPQLWFGNWWYFDSWNDGNVENPRTFDPSNGISAQAMLHSARPVGLDPASLDFVALPGAAPHAVAIRVYSQSNSLRLGPAIAPWLVVTLQKEVNGNTIISGSANVAGLTPGYYTTTFPLTVPDPLTGSPTAINVPASLRILDKQPFLPDNGIVSAANYQSPISPREIVAIFGTGLGPDQPQGGQAPAAGTIPYTLGGTSLLMNGNPAPLLYVSANVLLAIAPTTLPSGVAGRIWPLQLTVELGGVQAVSANTSYVDFAPGLFTLDASGRGGLAAGNPDGSINSPSNPALRGSFVSLYATGLQGIGLPCVDYIINGLLSPANIPTEATIGGKPADILFAGLVPGFVCAAQLINLAIPNDSAVGDAVPVQLRALSPDGSVWYTTQGGATLAIR